MEPTEPISYLLTQIAYVFSVSVNKSHSAKRDCLISACLLCINQTNEENPLTLFLPHFKIVLRSRDQHHTIFLLSKIPNYQLTLRIKSKKETEIREFYEALVIARASYDTFIASQEIYDVTVKGKEQILSSKLIVFDDSFEIQSEDEILLYADSIIEHPDVYASIDNPLSLNVSREGEMKFSFICVDVQELAIILMSLNKNGPAMKREKVSKKLVAIVPTEQREIIMEDSVLESELPSVSESVTESTALPKMRKDDVELLEEQCRIVRTKKFEDFVALSKSRSAYRHLRESFYKILFVKKRTKYGKGMKPVKLGVTFQQTSDLEFVPDVELHEDMKIASKTFSSFEQKMESKLAKFESHQNSFSKPAYEKQTIFSIITTYRNRDPLIEANPIPELSFPSNTTDEEEKLIKKSSATNELFHSSHCINTRETNDTPTSIDACVQFLSVLGIDANKYNMETKNKEKVNVKNEIEKFISTMKPQDIPSLFASILLHKSIGSAAIYNALNSLLFSVAETNETIMENPFSSFEECCSFFAKLIKSCSTKHFFIVIQRSHQFLEDRYQVDAIINAPGVLDAIIQIEPTESTDLITLTPIPLFFYNDYSKIIDKATEEYEVTPTVSWMHPISSSNPFCTVVSSIIKSYSVPYENIHKLWSEYEKAASFYESLEGAESKEALDILKEAKNSSLSPHFKLVYFTLKLISKKLFAKWYIATWNRIKINKAQKISNEDVIFITVAISKFQSAITKEGEANTDLIFSEVSRLVYN